MGCQKAVVEVVIEYARKTKAPDQTSHESAYYISSDPNVSLARRQLFCLMNTADRETMLGMDPNTRD